MRCSLTIPPITIRMINMNELRDNLLMNPTMNNPSYFKIIISLMNLLKLIPFDAIVYLVTLFCRVLLSSRVNILSIISSDRSSIQQAPGTGV